VTFLNVLEVRALIAYVVDLNPRKHLKYIAGTGQQIVPPEFLHTSQPEVAIVMNSISLAEIQALLDATGLHPVCIFP
jgi:hypothetical protein